MPKVKSSKSSSRKSNDPKAPKRHRTAYMLFSLEKRSQIKSENPGLTAKEIMSELGAQWSSSDPQTKQHYQKLSDAEKSEYVKKSTAYKNEKQHNKENSKKDNKPNQSMEVNSSQ
ncbi:unnamed protein product [Adineta steineri]|uniref:HMG box domain-containing protein n=1 Tax=Adineta steineri TaxID=433720 RepID=A0A815IEE3_9BILA|nr:unnamed protein product [Adineta steineri]